MVKWYGRLIVLFGVAHTLGALTAEGAARHAGDWFSGELWGASLDDMSPAMSAYWLSVDSFGVPFILVGLTVVWLDRRGITLALFIPWILLVWTVVDLVVLGPMPGQGVLFLIFTIAVLVKAHRSKRPDQAATVGTTRHVSSEAPASAS